MTDLNLNNLKEALELLNYHLGKLNSEFTGLVVCGGSALLAMDLAKRVTKDVDVVALMDSEHNLIEPLPLPSSLIKAANLVQRDLSLPENWLNNGPSSNEGGIFQLGLPDGFKNRLTSEKVGKNLTVYWISRFDQIHFKLWAAVDRFGGYHADDLVVLKPENDELFKAAQWSMSLDPSEGYQMMLLDFLRQMGYVETTGRLQKSNQ